MRAECVAQILRAPSATPVAPGRWGLRAPVLEQPSSSIWRASVRVRWGGLLLVSFGENRGELTSAGAADEPPRWRFTQRMIPCGSIT